MQILKKDGAGQKIGFFLIDSASRPNFLAGASPSAVISKNGDSFAAPAGSVVAVGQGCYELQLDAADVGTAGYLAVKVSATGADVFGVIAMVTAGVDTNVVTWAGTPVEISVHTRPVVDTHHYIGTDTLPADVTKWASTTVENSVHSRPIVDTYHYIGTDPIPADVTKWEGTAVEHSISGRPFVDANIWKINGEGSIEAGETFQVTMQVIRAAVAGMSDRPETGKRAFYAPDGTTMRLRANVDAETGDRGNPEVNP